MISFDINKDSFSRVHFIGIGGISMSALAEILIKEGFEVSGSDSKDSPIINKLRDKGATIYIGHESNNIKDGLDLVVFTDAISKDNPEYLEALNKKILTVDRGNFLGQLMKKYKDSIAVSGTHGKTTTTGMLSTILHSSHLDPTILLGGELDCINGNVRIGKDNLILTEACEYKGNILKFHSTIGVILNVEADHLDYYNSIDEIIDTFSGFVKLIPRDGHVIINNDDENAIKSVSDAVCNVVTFGIDKDSTYKANNVSFDQSGHSYFSLTIDNNESYDVVLSVTGIHNVYNSLGAIAAAHISGLDIKEVIEKIKDYKGTHRRLEYKGYFDGVRVIDDYAHHPTEIMATLKAVRNLEFKKTWCIFQPHTYTRTKSLLNEFSDAFFDADKVIIANIYAAREKDNGEIHSKDLVKMLKEKNVDAYHFDTFDEIVEFISKNVSEGDLVLTMGAGDVYKIGEILLDRN
ncbi:UDP-N-acetylmuramate--L-alanine ligase MurC [Gottschalkia acidurici 9a]|uniref:UDP-N-acetylmuramate--L-alanine ligase n=1 Tax=Gottschalkia acidurici (strain ATCC 7906 / DSM 604 / BCRC 14475 / CIP 104303 / KCTC 5404 / NCIMB 10678 / 9a) TaxID=1128398 RepID=K0B1P7_GOTA9|nr:UDP-N-acetylmuramate--L-alanine ligase [Gottschalkia acidurici]AFS79384.1 UDP-N-acetylmuramate--L-alanine ligase MurC [Gottschalkia acidurici 9a]